MKYPEFHNDKRLRKNLEQFEHMVPSEKWIMRGFKAALEAASWSKDPRRTVGAAVMDADKRFFVGFNGFPKHVCDVPQLLNDRDMKRALMVHAEANALDNAKETENSIMFVTAPCCHGCALKIVNKGIIAVHYLQPAPGDFQGYERSFEDAEEVFALAGVQYTPYSREEYTK